MPWPLQSKIREEPIHQKRTSQSISLKKTGCGVIIIKSQNPKFSFQWNSARRRILSLHLRWSLILRLRLKLRSSWIWSVSSLYDSPLTGECGDVPGAPDTVLQGPRLITELPVPSTLAVVEQLRPPSIWTAYEPGRNGQRDPNDGKAAPESEQYLTVGLLCVCIVYNVSMYCI